MVCSPAAVEVLVNTGVFNFTLVHTSVTLGFDGSFGAWGAAGAPGGFGTGGDPGIFIPGIFAPGTFAAGIAGLGGGGT